MSTKEDVRCKLSSAEIDAYCIAWAKWCRTRRYYIKSPPQNILARMQPSKSGEIPDARNYPDMQYFNMAIHALADMPKYSASAKSFKLYYESSNGDNSSLVKQMAHSLGVSRQTLHAHYVGFGRAAHSMSISLKAAHEAAKAIVTQDAAHDETVPA